LLLWSLFTYGHQMLRSHSLVSRESPKGIDFGYWIWLSGSPPSCTGQR
jgi:hypothetical protein